MIINTKNIIFLLLFISFSVFSQKTRKEKQNKFIGKRTFFGIAISPTIPTNFIQKNDNQKITDSSEYQVNMAPGYVFGMEIRHNFNRRISIQTGINFIRRNYDTYAILKSKNTIISGIDTTYTTTMDTSSQRLKFIAYEVPIIIHGFVRLSKEIYMDIGGGIGVEFYPSDIYANRFYGQRKSWIIPGLLFNIGWEYRNEKIGIIHIGASYKMHFTDIIHTVYTNKYGRRIDYIDASGNYFAINLKYYFYSKRAQ